MIISRRFRLLSVECVCYHEGFLIKMILLLLLREVIYLRQIICDFFFLMMNYFPAFTQLNIARWLHSACQIRSVLKSLAFEIP